MNELEYQKAASEMADPEAEKSHRQRMMDTEYEGAQKDINAANFEQAVERVIAGKATAFLFLYL